VWPKMTRFTVSVLMVIMELTVNWVS